MVESALAAAMREVVSRCHGWLPTSTLSDLVQDEALLEMKVIQSGKKAPKGGWSFIAYQDKIWLVDPVKWKPDDGMELYQDLAKKLGKDNVPDPRKAHGFLDWATELDQTIIDIFVGTFNTKKKSIHASHTDSPSFRSSPLVKKVVKQLGAMGLEYYEDGEDGEYAVRIDTRDKIPDVMYHGTSSEYARGILREGLRPGMETNWDAAHGHYGVFKEHVFVVDSPLHARWHAEDTARKVGGSPVVLEVKIPDKDKLTPDWDADSASASMKKTFNKTSTSINNRSTVDSWKTTKSTGRFGYKGRIPGPYIRLFGWSSDAYDSYEDDEGAAWTERNPGDEPIWKVFEKFVKQGHDISDAWSMAFDDGENEEYEEEDEEYEDFKEASGPGRALPSWFKAGTPVSADDLEEVAPDAPYILEGEEFDYAWRLCDVPIKALGVDPGMKISDYIAQHLPDGPEESQKRMDRASSSSPAIVLIEDGSPRLVDGWHRMGKAIASGKKTLRAVCAVAGPQEPASLHESIVDMIQGRNGEHVEIHENPTAEALGKIAREVKFVRGFITDKKVYIFNGLVLHARVRNLSSLPLKEAVPVVMLVDKGKICGIEVSDTVMSTKWFRSNKLKDFILSNTYIKHRSDKSLVDDDDFITYYDEVIVGKWHELDEGLVQESTLPAVADAEKILGDRKMALKVAGTDPYPDKRMTPTIAQWLKKQLIQKPEEHQADVEKFKELRGKLKVLRVPHENMERRKRVKALLAFDPTSAATPSRIQAWNKEVSGILDLDKDLSDDGLKVVGRHNGFTMYEIKDKQDCEVPLVKNTMSWCVTKSFYGEYGGPPYYPVVRDKDKTPFAMVIPNYFDEDPDEAVRNGTNSARLSPLDMRKIKPLLRMVLPKEAFKKQKEYIGAIHDDQVRIPKTVPRDPQKVIDLIRDRGIVPGEWPEGEDAIAKSPEHAIVYAMEHIGGRWPRVEPLIARTSPEVASAYAISVVKGPWPEGEEIISKSAEDAMMYARDAIGGRWPKGEAAIAKSKFATSYASLFIKGPWPEAEGTIAKDPHASFSYATEILKKRWPKGEDAIATDPASSVNYAMMLVKAPWPKGEKSIAKDASASYRYAKHVLRGSFEEGEEAISKDPWNALQYATDVLHAPWPMGEKAIRQIDKYWKQYQERFPWINAKESLGHVFESTLPAVADAEKILGDRKMALKVAGTDPYPDKRMTPTIAQWIKDKHVKNPEEHKEDIEQFKSLRSMLKSLRISMDQGDRRKRVKDLLKFDPTSAKTPSRIQEWNKEVSGILDPHKDLSDNGLKVVGSHNGFTMYEIKDKQDCEVPLVKNTMSWCVTKGFYGEYGGPPYYAVVRDKDKSPFAMVIPAYFVEDPDEAVRNGTNSGRLSPLDMRKIKPLLRMVLPKEAFNKQKEYIGAIHSDRANIPRTVPKDLSSAVGIIKDRAIAPGEWPEAEDALARSPKHALAYAEEVIHGRWPKAEPFIADGPPEHAYAYAAEVVKGRWPEGEKAIVKSPRYAFHYAKNVVHGKWEKGEEAIAESASFSYLYAEEIIKGRWPKGEKAIIKEPDVATNYARYIVNGRWPEAEPFIMKNGLSAAKYATHVLKKRWPEAEEAIANCPHAATMYAAKVLEEPWPMGEAIIAKDPFLAMAYAIGLLKKPWPEAEPAIATNANAAVQYANEVLGRRFEAGEAVIAKNAWAAYQYAAKVIGGRWPMGEKAMSKDPVVWEKYKALIDDGAVKESFSLAESTRLVDIDDLPKTTKDDIVDWMADAIPQLENDPDMARENLIGLEKPPKLALGKVKLSSLKGWRERGVSDVAVKKYADMLKGGSEPPPILVAHGKFVDGGHRAHAAAMAGIDEVPAVDIGPLIDMDWDQWLDNPDYNPFTGGGHWEIAPEQDDKAYHAAQPDGYYYHVTTKDAAPSILRDGLRPGQPALFKNYSSISRGKVFLSDRDGVAFWKEKVEQHLFDKKDYQEDEDPADDVVVLRIPKDKVSVKLEPDSQGTRDSGANAWFASHLVEGSE